MGGSWIRLSDGPVRGSWIRSPAGSLIRLDGRNETIIATATSANSAVMIHINGPPRPLFAAVSPKSDQVAIHTPQLLVCLCATFEHADASLEAVLPGLGGLYLCLIRQPSKQNLAFNLYGRRELDLFSKPSSQDFHLSISLREKHGALRWPL